MIGCDCPVCTSNNPKNRRTRASVAVRSGETTLLVDSGPDLHWQALRENLRRLDAVLYTHEHLDHVAGFDELRAFCWRREDPLPLYAGPAACTNCAPCMLGPSAINTTVMCDRKRMNTATPPSAWATSR